MWERSVSVIFCFICCYLSTFVASDDVHTETTTFTLNPGPSSSASVKKMGLRREVTCSFHYTAQGGTNEDWVISLKGSESSPDEMYCTVMRDGKTSYLFFQTFSLKVEGAKIDSNNVILMHKGNPLSSEQYRVDSNSGKITTAGQFTDGGKKSQVSSTDRFKYELGNIAVRVLTEKEEL